MLAGAHRLDGRLGQRLGGHIPLIGEIRLDHDAGTVAMRHRVRIRLDLVEEPLLLQRFTICLRADEAIEAVQSCERLSSFGRSGDPSRRNARCRRELSLAFDVEHVDQRQMMPPADLEIVEVMRRRDLDRAGALLRVGIFIRDDRDAAAHQRQDGIAPTRCR